MSCTRVPTADGNYAILCDRGRRPKAAACDTRRGRVRCPFPAVALCDYPLGGGRTCSARICSDHRAAAGALDFCPAHAPERAPLLPGFGP